MGVFCIKIKKRDFLYIPLITTDTKIPILIFPPIFPVIEEMQFRILSLFALVAAAVAQQGSGDNAFKIPPGGIAFTAGQPATISWTPSTGGTVTLKLREGAASALNPGTVIKCKLFSSQSTFPIFGRLVMKLRLSCLQSGLLPFRFGFLWRKRYLSRQQKSVRLS